MAKSKKQNSTWLSLLLNIVIPSLILVKLSSPEKLGAFWALLLALSFPIGFGLYELLIQKKRDVLSLVGVVSTLITGLVGFFELDAFWIAVKESAIPFVIGIFIAISPHTRYPIIKKILYGSDIIDTQKIQWALKQYGTQEAFDQHLRNASYLLAGSFFVSSLLNYFLARAIVVSPSGTTAFNEEIGKMTALSYPIIVIPSMILSVLVIYYIFRGIKKYTNFSVKELVLTNS